MSFMSMVVSREQTKKSTKSTKPIKWSSPDSSAKYSYFGSNRIGYSTGSISPPVFTLPVFFTKKISNKNIHYMFGNK